MNTDIVYIETKTDKIPLCFNLNVMEEIQDLYGSMSKWGEKVEDKENGEPKIKDLKNGLLAMINEGIDIENQKRDDKKPLMTSKEVGRIIDEIGFKSMVAKIKEITIKSTKTDNDTKNE